MSRSASRRALVLRTRASGESNREAWMLCEGEGILRATVFGGPKSRLRALAAPFHSGRAWIYHNPVKDSRKLEDFDAQSLRPGIRELYERAMSAEALAQTVIESRGGGGGWDGALALAEEALDALAEADAPGCAVALSWFLWRWVDFLGLRPDLLACASCGRPALDEGAAAFSPRQGGALCRNCRPQDARGGLLPLGRPCANWIAEALRAAPGLVCAPDDEPLREAKAIACAILAESLGRRLGSWEF